MKCEEMMVRERHHLRACFSINQGYRHLTLFTLLHVPASRIAPLMLEAGHTLARVLPIPVLKGD